MKSALGTRAALSRPRNESLIGYLLAQPMQETGLSYNDDFIRRRFFAKGNHLLSRANFIGLQTHGVSAFRMG